MGITDKYKLIIDNGVRPEDIDPYYTVIGIVMIIAAIFAFVQNNFITYIVGALILYGAVYVIFESYNPVVIKDE